VLLNYNDNVLEIVQTLTGITGCIEPKKKRDHTFTPQNVIQLIFIIALKKTHKRNVRISNGELSRQRLHIPLHFLPLGCVSLGIKTFENCTYFPLLRLCTHFTKALNEKSVDNV
jgi:hypothetical protein